MKFVNAKIAKHFGVVVALVVIANLVGGVALRVNR